MTAVAISIDRVIGLEEVIAAGALCLLVFALFFRRIAFSNRLSVSRRREFDAKARLASIVETSDDSIIRTTADGVITSWNAESGRMYGYSAEQAIGQPASLIVPADQMAQLDRLRDQVIRGELIATFEAQRIRRDGTRVDVSVTLTPVRAMSGPAIGISAVTRDLTESNRAVEALRASEARLSAILASAADAIITIDHEGRVQDFNPAAERIFGYPSADVIGRCADVLIPPEHDHDVLEYLTTGRANRTEITAKRSDGTSFQADVTINLIDAHDGVPVFAAFIRDVTDRNQAEADRRSFEDRRQQSERLESLGQLAGGVAHDFNNLLVVILNHAAFAGEVAAGDDAILSHIAEITSASERAARLTRQLLMFARREPVRTELLDLNSVIEDVRSILVSSIGAQIELVVRSDGRKARVVADRGQMEQILLNLAVNARDAMPDGGTLIIRTTSTTMRGSDFVELEVSDTGTGMPADVAAHAFEPFFTTKSASAGTGLGLATVHSIVTAAGGALNLSSVEGQGTTIEMSFPAVDAADAPATPSRTSPRMRGAGETVLVVEDEAAVRATTLLILQRNGYAAVGAASAAEALELVQRQHFDLLLTDVIMPKVSGFELVEQLRARGETFPVLYMSGYAQRALLVDRVRYSDGLIQKPFTEAAILDAVNTSISARATARP